MPPPCRWPPPATSRPLVGATQDVVSIAAENRFPVPGTSYEGSSPLQLRTSSQIGFTGVSCSPVAYCTV